MPKIKILHISDIHFDPAATGDTQLIVANFLSDLDRVVKEQGLALDLIIFSGDLVKAGGQGDAAFQALQNSLFDPLLRTCNLGKGHLFIVPGNHDIDSDIVEKNWAIQAGLYQELVSRSAINEFYDAHSKDTSSAFYFARLSNYEKASPQFGATFKIKSNPFFTAYQVPLGKEHIGIIALNSAWLATGKPKDFDKGKLIIPERAVIDALAELKLCTFKIAAMHHPLEYLHDRNRVDVRALLLKNVDLICCGHVHMALPEVVNSPVGQAVFSQAGAPISPA